MNKIIEKLLTVTFPNVNTADLLEIVGATPNPELATEILCGLYVEPKLPIVVQDNSVDKKELTFSSYDKWTDRVCYLYIKERTINGYFPKDTIKEDITLDNFKEKQVDWRSGQDQINISLKTGESILDSSYCSSSDWLRYTVVEEYPKVVGKINLD